MKTMTDTKIASTNLQIATADVTENPHVSAPESTPTLCADDLAPLKKIHNKHAGRGKHLRGKAATDVQQAYQRALSVATDGVREYLSNRAEQVDDAASDISDASMEVADDESPPPSLCTGCGPCRDNQHGANWKERLDGAAPAAGDDSEDPVPSDVTAPTHAADAEDSACVEHSSADDVSEQSSAELESADAPPSPSSSGVGPSDAATLLQLEPGNPPVAAKDGQYKHCGKWSA
jgi:hypothetical protein